ncbi:DUF58 domain-containing protein [Haloglomus halophilum]|uniref:DUF58 domain-containing protein n=1 Tax=Haloglomus halophilum TaxID=2962672 RepID=UPI0020CA0282|nr:DUF58 domain-containing protein [Haloglomus halophilum]
MHATRRAWAVAATALVLAALAVAFERPLLLFAGATVGAWLLAHQYLFTHRAATLDERLTVEQSLAPGRVATDDPATVTLSLTAPDGSPLDVHAEGRRPVAGRAVDDADTTLELSRGQTDASTTFGVTVPVAGAHAVPQPTLHLADGRGLFHESIERGPTPRLTVEPRAPRNVHVGVGGDSVAAAYGEHDAGRIGSGLEPAEVRKYIAGDEAKRIDWKATARLNEPHVREFEAETDRTTVLLIDHRATTGLGRDGQRVLDYLREVAIAYLESARELDDPLGCYAVGDEGITVSEPPNADLDTYTTIREALTGLEPTEAPSGHGRADRPRREARTPATARRDAVRLADEETPFASTLRPFLETADPYVERVDANPLFAATRSRLTRLRGSTWTVILTDDRDRAELREAVKVARRGDDHVVVFVAPRVLYEPDAMSDLEAAYDRYLDFEEFRRSLAALDRVEAFEVAPGDRIGALLAQQQRRRQASGGAAGTSGGEPTAKMGPPRDGSDGGPTAPGPGDGR